MMVQWSAAPADILWAEAAWVNMGLTTGDLGTECIWIPKQFVPDQSREWYFCSSAAAYDAAVTCLALPMITAGRKVCACRRAVLVCSLRRPAHSHPRSLAGVHLLDAHRSRAWVLRVNSPLAEGA